MLSHHCKHFATYVVPISSSLFTLNESLSPHLHHLEHDDSLAPEAAQLVSSLPPLLQIPYPGEPSAPVSYNCFASHPPTFFQLLPREIFSLVSQMHSAIDFPIIRDDVDIFTLFWNHDAVSNQVWANGLFRFAAEKFYQFRPAELLAFTGGRSKHYLSCESLMMLIEQFYRLMGFVYLSTLLKSSFESRLVNLERWIAIAELCLANNDFFSSGAIISAMLTNPLADWLQRNHAKVAASPTYNVLRGAMIYLFSPIDGFGAIRERMNRTPIYLAHPTSFVRDRHEGPENPPLATRWDERRTRFYDAGIVCESS